MLTVFPLLLALSTGTAPPGESQEQQGLEQAASLYEEGTVRFDAADYVGAIEKFTAALAIVKREGGDDKVRLSLLYNIGAAHEKQFEIDKDVSHLRQALALYRQYEDFAERQADLEEELDIRVKVLDLERRLRTHDDIERNRAAAEHPRDVPPPPSSTTGDDGWKRHRNVGIGLVVPGGAALIGGAVMLALGSGFESNAQEQVDELADLGIPPDHPAWAEGDEFIAAEKSKGVALMAVGSVLAVVGVVGVGVGAWELSRARKGRAGSVSLRPAFGPGLVLQGEF